MTEITYLRGDATCPQAKGPKIICHICHDIGGWGKGFVLALSKRWKQPEAEYRAWYAKRRDRELALGAVQFVPVESTIWVANMIGQHGIKTGSSGPPIRYDAVSQCLMKVAENALELGASVHMPRIGCGLAGGQWAKIEPLITENLLLSNIAVTVYDFD
jgi:O-acetyl-ADP-ribose deacetylase (regulator of RNase III)